MSSESKKILFKSFDYGITHFDLANNYGPPYGQWWKQCRANGQWGLTPKDLIFLDRGRTWGALSG